MKIMMLLYKKISNQENRISEKFKKLNKIIFWNKKI
jgi:hypothetical protein